MDVKKYMRESLVTPELLLSYFVECGGYTGLAKKVSFEESIYDKKSTFEGMCNRELVYLLPKEIAFGNYLKAIKLLVIGRNNMIDLRDSTKREYIQGLIDRNVADLFLLASRYISKDKHKITYDCKKFEDSVKDNFPDLAEIAPLMPYVIYYISLRQGFDLKYPQEVITPFDKSEKLKSNLNAEIVFHPQYKVTDESMLRAIGEHMHVDYDRFLKDRTRVL